MAIQDKDKEFLGKVSTSQGEFQVYLPQVKDVEDCNINDPSFLWRLGAASIDIPYEDFRMWNIPDALKVCNMVSEGLMKL